MQEKFLHLAKVLTLGRRTQNAGKVPTLGMSTQSAGIVPTLGQSSYTWKEHQKCRKSAGKVERPPKVLEILKDKRKTTLLCLVLMLSQSEEKLEQP